MGKKLQAKASAKKTSTKKAGTKKQKATKATASNSSGITRRSGNSVMFAGTVPFVWSIDIYLLQSFELGKEAWSVTVHLTAQGTITQVFKSNTEKIVPDQECVVWFPAIHVIGEASYYMEACAMGEKSDDNTVSVKMSLPKFPNTSPTIEVVDTRIKPTWIIGAREIILTDPPLAPQG